MAEPPVPEELAFKIPTESVIDLRMHWHGVLYCRDHLRRVNLNVNVSTRMNELEHRPGWCSEHSGKSRSEILSESEMHSHHHVVMHRPAKTDRTMLPP